MSGAGGGDAEEMALLALPPVAPPATERYGPHPSQVIDLYGPPGGPRVTVLHGGFWRQRYDRAHLSPLAAALAGQGLRVALVEYRRVGGDGGWPNTFTDIRAALHRLGQRPRGRGRGDGDGPDDGDGRGAGDGPDDVDGRRAVPGGGEGREQREVLLGHSAGGQLALWAAATDPAVRAVLAVAPVADLARAHELGLSEGAVAALLGGPQQVAERLAQTDPMRLPRPPCPVTVLHGTDDAQVPVDLSRRYAAATGARLRELPCTGHYAPVTPGTAAFGRLLTELRAAGRGGHGT